MAFRTLQPIILQPILLLLLLLLARAANSGSFSDALPSSAPQLRGMVTKFQTELENVVGRPAHVQGDLGPSSAGTGGAISVSSGTRSGLRCDADGWTTYGKVYGPCNACGFSHDAIVDILAREHDCSKDVFWKGAWIPGSNLTFIPREDELSCVLLCAERIRCQRPPCLLDMHVRPGTTDALVLVQVFFYFNFFDVPKNLTAPRSILDAGANIGAASVYFALMFPNSSIVAVEASEENYRVLRANTRRFPNVVPVLAAVWSATSSLCLVNDKRARNEWGNRVLPCDAVAGRTVLHTMQGLPIPLLSKIFGIPHFDWLKIDIEGAEGQVFAETADVDFLKTGQVLFCELHDQFWPNATQIVTKAMAGVPRWKDWGMHNELMVWLAL